MMTYTTPQFILLLEERDPVMASFEGNTLDLWDMLIGQN